MSRFERWGARDLSYSNWHRQFCDDRVTMIDVDGLEYCRRCRAPLALIEVAQDVGQAFKPVTALEQLSLAANVPAFCALYRTDPESRCEPDPRGRCRRIDCNHGISAFRVRRIRPNPTEFQSWTPAQFAAYLTRLHDLHEEVICQAVIGTRGGVA